MSDTEVKISEATADQLREYGRLYLGLAFTDTTPAEKMRAEIAKATQKDTIIIVSPAPRGQARADLPKRIAKPDPSNLEDSEEPAEDRGEQLVRILIQRTDEPGGDRPVFVSVNGIAIWIARGKTHEVKRKYVEALDHAVKIVYDQEEVDGKPVGRTAREAHTYPFSYA